MAFKYVCIIHMSVIVDSISPLSHIHVYIHILTHTCTHTHTHTLFLPSHKIHTALVELLTEPGSLQFDMQEPDSPSNSPVMSNLTDLIHVVHACLGQHQGMQSTEIKDAAKNVMNCFQSKLFKDSSHCCR